MHPVPAPDALGQGLVDPGRLHPQLGDALPLRLQERKVSEERGDLVTARGRDELEQQTPLVAAPLVEPHRPLDAPERELLNAKAAGSRFQRRQQPAPQALAPHGGGDREVIDCPEPVTIHMAEHDASDLVVPLGGQHHRRLVGQPLMEEAGTAPTGLQGREGPQEEPAGKIQLPRRPDGPDRELAHGWQSYARRPSPPPATATPGCHPPVTRSALPMRIRAPLSGRAKSPMRSLTIEATYDL